ncbi:MAG TPA: molybdenum ABC transporter ATP-binding protein [Chitinispirillaceae bacterium]|nr:molybdenum ABC transporter ATP-binding protein [Chitinispirillaceae bacterium]
MNNIQARFLIKRSGFTFDVDLEIAGRGVTVFFGHSGSGKTTILRCIAGLERASQGYLCVNGKIWQDSSFFLPTYKRPLGYVFQESSLFPHLTVLGNLCYGMKRVVKAQRADLEKAIELLDIAYLLKRKPDGLSGGEKQRVAIARAITINPSILLMDEPLASLDIKRRQEILPYLKELRDELDIPVLYVSHNPDEVVQLADNMVIMEEGSIIANGTLEHVVTKIDLPVKIGEDAGVVFEASIAKVDTAWNLCRIDFSGGSIWARDSGIAVGSSVRIRILARDVSISKKPLEQISIQNSLQGVVDAIGADEHPGLALVRVKIGASFILSRLTRRAVMDLELNCGDSVWVHVKSAATISYHGRRRK